MKVELSNGDILDRFSILQIKEDKFVSESKRRKRPQGATGT